MGLVNHLEPLKKNANAIADNFAHNTTTVCHLTKIYKLFKQHTNYTQNKQSFNLNNTYYLIFLLNLIKKENHFKASKFIFDFDHFDSPPHQPKPPSPLQYVTFKFHYSNNYVPQLPYIYYAAFRQIQTHRTISKFSVLILKALICESLL